MAHLHDYGEEYMQKLAWNDTSIVKPETLQIGLYYTELDDLEESDNLDSITSEPDNTQGYERVTVNLDDDADITIDTSGDDATMVLRDINWDVEGNEEAVDAWFIVGEFQSEKAGDTEPSENLLITGVTDIAQDLGQSNAIQIRNISLELT